MNSRVQRDSRPATSRTTLALALVAVLSLGAYGCASDGSSRSAGTVVDDATITAGVKSALIGDSDMKARDINVDTYRGRVQLSGFVDSQAQIDKATEIARKRDGVVSVQNNLRIKQDGQNSSMKTQ
ncbi:MAG: BON domain-containing protein [Burkholderiales bacterium]|nr:BON domain-containing protein [Burkholderiales bacterium]